MSVHKDFRDTGTLQDSKNPARCFSLQTLCTQASQSDMLSHIGTWMTNMNILWRCFYLYFIDPKNSKHLQSTWLRSEHLALQSLKKKQERSERQKNLAWNMVQTVQVKEHLPPSSSSIANDNMLIMLHLSTSNLRTLHTFLIVYLHFMLGACAKIK